MKIRIAKWGNSLAVRLPAEYVRAIGARPGDSVEAEIGPLGKMTLMPTHNFDKAVFLTTLRKLRAGMPATSSTIEAQRKDDRY